MVSLATYCRIVNLIERLKGRDLRVAPYGRADLHRATHGGEEILLCRRTRARRYKRGVLRGCENLARQYSLHLAEITPGGVFVDCGANIGELGIWARAQGMSYVAFEPEDDEADCIDINNFDGQPTARRQALWHTTQTLKLFSKPETADSSVFDSGQTHGVHEIDAVALDDARIDLSGPGTHIFKLEAEGAEPEILDGATATLPLFDYVAVDCGPERGMSHAHTFIEVNERLSAAGFTPVAAEFGRVTLLYRNTRK